MNFTDYGSTLTTQLPTGVGSTILIKGAPFLIESLAENNAGRLTLNLRAYIYKGVALE